jgi:hypothetical protein
MDALMELEAEAEEPKVLAKADITLRPMLEPVATAVLQKVFIQFHAVREAVERISTETMVINTEIRQLLLMAAAVPTTERHKQGLLDLSIMDHS